MHANPPSASAWQTLPPIVPAAGAQLLALGVLGTMLGLVPETRYLPVWMFVLTQALLACAVSGMLRLPAWWLLIQALFAPVVAAAQLLSLNPVWYLVSLLLLASLYRGAVFDRVPLYLSSQAACAAIAQQLPERPGLRFLDLGCGPAGLLAKLARTRPEACFHGIENAPLSYLLACIRLAIVGNARVTYGDLRSADLGEYDVVYAYLSPAAMPSLWHKARLEMRPGALFISNSFNVPGVEPHEVVDLDNDVGAGLLLWRL